MHHALEEPEEEWNGGLGFFINPNLNNSSVASLRLHPPPPTNDFLPSVWQRERHSLFSELAESLCARNLCRQSNLVPLPAEVDGRKAEAIFTTDHHLALRARYDAMPVV